jgi:4-hydroxyphenylpyruvate dioxygenase
MSFRQSNYLIFLVALVVAGELPMSVRALSTPKGAWKPKIAALDDRRVLRGQEHDSETIGSIGFHHIEFYCGDAKSMAFRFAQALGMRITGETGQMTGNDQCISYGLESGDFRLLLTAPYSQAMASSGDAAPKTGNSDAPAPNSLPSFSVDGAHAFFQKHGLAAKAIGLEVLDAQTAFENAVANGANPVLETTFVPACLGQKDQSTAGCNMAEVSIYGDVVLRFVSFSGEGAQKAERVPFLPHLSPTSGKIAEKETYGIYKIDHAVGNVPDLQETLTHVSAFTGFHEFAEFTAEDVGTVDSGLNSVVLASNSEDVLLPLNEPTQGRRKSQIQTYLEQNEGAGLQHLALKSYDIFSTIRQMKDAEENFGGFELMTKPSDSYYRELPERLGDQLTVRSTMIHLLYPMIAKLAIFIY